ncbi:TonB-dependent receptor [Xanthocytophaga agilis]|uniref:TonB-dependent receptor n=1 Tax=Xanthocytophaga agilis TaxID=3048010 RepID=A0AAE3R3U7_9BACT|nr:TonB-dependent receptor [Xanthocytophaga agilis]MDJ1500874.1 TonB-dependent receptor [Xanthocytophaga agilis]
MLKRLLTLSILFLALLAGKEVVAQGVTTAAISGIITDAKGEALPGATVIAVHTPSGTQYSSLTRPDGRYNFPNVRIGGPYTITITFVGYKEQKVEGINLSIGQNFNFSPKMSDQGVELSEIVVSSTRNPVLNSDRTGAATNISRETIQALPTLNRSFNDYVRLTPQAGANSSFAGRNGGYNNITIDGALFNNAFGLSGTVGGQTNAQPISLDAVDQIAVSIAPYDVREGSFTGAGVNVVTRSGTNDFSGSVYYFTRNQGFIGKKVSGTENKLANFKLHNYGFRLGGPIIKNKLFFFVNMESERRDDPPTPNFIATRPGVTGSNVSSVTAAELDELSTFLQSKFGYNAGPYENYQLASNSDKATAKIDWNITNQHKFSIKYNYLKSYRDVNPSNSGAITSRSPSNTGLPFLGAFYRINNNLNSVIAELNSSFGTKFSNKFQVGYTAFRDFRETPTSSIIFPGVDIGNGAGSQLTAFGYEPFSAFNVLNTNVFQISDNFDIYLGKNTLTVGTYNEFYKFENGFAPNYYGTYQFASLQDFYDNINGVTREDLVSENNPTGAVLPARYQFRYSTLPNGAFPLAEIKAHQLGFYVQDKYEINSRLNMTLGLRADIPTISSPIARNEQAAGYNFRDGQKIFTDQVQKTQLLWSPRFGFNWDVKGDRTTQVRGGTGIFTGRVPYVWISNQASNNGVLFGSIDLLASSGGFTTKDSEGNVSLRPEYKFSPNVDANRPTNATASSTYNLAVTDKSFKFPQVWRSNLAIDQQLPWGIVGTLEAAYTKDLNAVYHQNINLPNATSTAAGVDGTGADKRPVFYNRTVNSTTGAVSYPATNRINSNITDAILMKNTNKGYSYFITAQLQKSFTKNFYASAAYTYSDAKSVNDGGSIAQSIWRDRYVSGDPNANVLANTQYLQKHRIVLSASYAKEYAGFMKTTLSLFYEAGPSGYFSYIYTGDMNGDSQTNDLIYIPRDQSEIVLRDLYLTRNSNGVITGTSTTKPSGATAPDYTAAQQWADLDAYIKQDKYLSSRRGQYAERNGAMLPWRGQLDIRLLQDFFIKTGTKRNTLQFSLDIFNFGNMINSNWGVYQSANRASLLSYSRYNTTTGLPEFTYPYLNAASQTRLTKTFQDSFGVASRWQMQFGVRYIFN